MSDLQLDRAGRRRSPATMPGFLAGRAPRWCRRCAWSRQPESGPSRRYVEGSTRPRRWPSRLRCAGLDRRRFGRRFRSCSAGCAVEQSQVHDRSTQGAQRILQLREYQRIGSSNRLLDDPLTHARSAGVKGSVGRSGGGAASASLTRPTPRAPPLPARFTPVVCRSHRPTWVRPLQLDRPPLSLSSSTTSASTSAAGASTYWLPSSFSAVSQAYSP